MRYIKLRDLRVSRIGLGAMGMSHGYTGSGTDDAESIRTVHRALELGVTLIDTAEIYGPYTNEVLLGRALRGHRDRVVLATKFGLVSHAGDGAWNLDSSPTNIRSAVEGSLKRLGTDHIDLYYQHRVDPNTPIEETAGAVGELIAEGKVRAFGFRGGPGDRPPRPHRPAGHRGAVRVLAVHPRDRGARAACPAGAEHRPRAALPARTRLLTGTIHSTDQFDEGGFRRDNPRFTGENFQRNLALADEVKALAAEVGATPAQVALAWLLAQGIDMAPIPGTKRVTRVEENTAADTVTLTAGQLHKLSSLPPASGDTHTEAEARMLER